MRYSFSRRSVILSLLAAPLAMIALFARVPVPAFAPQGPQLSTPTLALPTPTSAVVPVAAALVEPTNAPPTPIPPSPTPAPPPVTSTPSIEPTPTARAAGTPLRVGLQVGHWKSNELPDELARLRTSTGAYVNGRSEAEVNLDVALRTAKLLQQVGIVVDVLPATVPPKYDADAFVSLHADGSTSGAVRGFKLATPWRTSRASQHLLDVMTAEYATATGMPQDDAITFNMRGYYAFSYRRHEHTIAKTTPAVIVEMGFMTSAADREILFGKPDTIAVGIANGIIRYLNERDPNDGAALLPPDFKTQRPNSAAGANVRAAPRDDARVLFSAGPEDRLIPFQERDGWYQVVVRGQWRIVGWVKKNVVVETNDPLPTPPPASDS